MTLIARLGAGADPDRADPQRVALPAQGLAAAAGSAPGGAASASRSGNDFRRATIAGARCSQIEAYFARELGTGQAGRAPQAL